MDTFPVHEIKTLKSELISGYANGIAFVIASSPLEIMKIRI